MRIAVTTLGNGQGLLLQCNILYCALQQWSPGAHDQTFKSPGHHGGCSWMRARGWLGSCRGAQAAAEGGRLLVWSWLSRQAYREWRAVQHPRADRGPQEPAVRH